MCVCLTHATFDLFVSTKCQQTLESNDEIVNNDFVLCLIHFAVINNFTSNRKNSLYNEY